jgi:hypothetical protein
MTQTFAMNSSTSPRERGTARDAGRASARTSSTRHPSRIIPRASFRFRSSSDWLALRTWEDDGGGLPDSTSAIPGGSDA